MDKLILFLSHLYEPSFALKPGVAELRDQVVRLEIWSSRQRLLKPTPHRCTPFSVHCVGLLCNPSSAQARISPHSLRFLDRWTDLTERIFFGDSTAAWAAADAAYQFQNDAPISRQGGQSGPLTVAFRVFRSPRASPRLSWACPLWLAFFSSLCALGYPHMKGSQATVGV